MTAPQSDLVLGVAGHIDHGKTALVKALTGVDTDRLPEEKARGITIELGFAPFALPGGRRCAVIDMPGHEKFVRTMISGAGGVDLLLLVVAASEGVMPQTREHLAIASLLGVRGAVCALSKTDLVTPDIVELAAEEVREVLQGTPFRDAPIVPVSAHRGDGLDALREHLAARALSPREPTGPCLLPIDRVFVRKGFGVVVTGTLVGGCVREGEALVVGPLGVEGDLLGVRVRGLQVHGSAVAEARAGTRLAVNVSGLDQGLVSRGAWLFREGAVPVTRAFDAEVTLLPETRRALGRRAKLELAVGATHALATVRALEGDGLAPGSVGLARISTDRWLALRPGERLILRGPPSLAGVGSTVGGAVVVRPVAERVRRRAGALERARRASRGDPAERARVELEALGAKGLGREALTARTGYAVREGHANDGLVALQGDRYVGRGVVEALENEVLGVLSAYHGKHPGERGMDLRALGSLADEVLLEAVLSGLGAARKVTREGDLVWRAGWRAKNPDDVLHLLAVKGALAGAGLAPPRPSELGVTLRATGAEVEAALKRLVERGDVARVAQDLYVDAAALGALEAKLVQWLREKGSIDAQGYKDLTGLSRKYVIPYAEHFDHRRVTFRVGDLRKLREK
ncbi:MAG: selenocysteine-specific translation elongation factor [Deltaproteobacteria bacterium]|nr:selenocysteine-specific translation elongation factor [Deltaproteobacteria bacterium]